MTIASRLILAVVALVAAACSTSRPAPRPVSPSSSPSSSSAPSSYVPGAVSGDVVDEAHELWLKLKTNAEKMLQTPAGDLNQGWLERAIDSDGRELFTLLSRSEFDPYSVARGRIRARLLFVVKPPSPEDRREAVQAVDQEFGELMKRRGGAPKRAPDAERAPS